MILTVLDMTHFDGVGHVLLKLI